jgi:hypothetical protein
LEELGDLLVTPNLIDAGAVIEPATSIKIDPAAPAGFLVHSFAGDDPIECKDYVRD